MKKITLVAVAISLILLSGCAKDYYTSYKSNNTDKDVGSLIIRFSDPIKSVNVTLDGNLVAEDKFTERIEIDKVPVGEHEVKAIASSWQLKKDINKTAQIDVQPNGKQTMLVQVPPKSTGYWIYQAVTFSVIFSTSYYLYY